MKLVKFELNGHDVQFFCNARDTRNGFAHDATFFVDGVQWNEGHCYYLNRTWEHWNYQSACLEAVADSLTYEENGLKDLYKRENGITRIVGDKRKAELKAYIDSSKRVAFLRSVKQVLKDRCF